MSSEIDQLKQQSKHLSNLRNNERLNSVKEHFKLSLFILFIYTIFSLLKIGCPIRFFTGISCPGCGMTRAVLSVLRLDFASAFYYHPLFLLAPIMYLLFLFSAYIPPALNKIAWVVIICIFLFVYIFRLFIVQSSVVSIDISNGIVLRLINQILVGGLQ